MIAKVVVSKAIDKEFDYLIETNKKVKLGMRVLVDFRGNKFIGIVSGFKKTTSVKNLKPILNILDNKPILTSEHFKLATNLTKIYPYNLGVFLYLMLPDYLKKNIKYQVEYWKVPPKGSFRSIFFKADSFKKRYEFWKEKINERLKEGSVLVCFPQVSYLESAKKIIEKDFPQVKTIHSYHTQKELFLKWKETRQKSLILGTKISVFYYPLDLKLIIIEEENSPYYFQESKPFYRLLEVVYILAKIKGIELLFSADYPSIFLFQLIRNKKVNVHFLKEDSKEIKVIEVLDKKNIISPLLIELLRKYIGENKKILILWNKKGWGVYLKCSVCGYTLRCKRCFSFLKMLESQEGICPYCQKKYNIPKICEECKSGYIKSIGIGTEKLESIIRRIFPEINIGNWENKSVAQVVISTSKVLSYLYEDQIFDVGFVLDIDKFFSSIDYNANFEAFLYLKKISFLFKETVYVFTRNINHYIFENLNKDWNLFYEKEIYFRNKLSLPPFGFIAKITLRAKNKDNLFKKSLILYNKLKKERLNIYGPIEDYPFKLRDKFRYVIVVKSKKRTFLIDTIKREINKLKSSSLKIAVKLE